MAAAPEQEGAFEVEQLRAEVERLGAELRGSVKICPLTGCHDQKARRGSPPDHKLEESGGEIRCDILAQQSP